MRLLCPKVQLSVSPEKEMIVRQVKDSIHNKKKILPLSPQRVTNKIMHGVVEQTHMKKIFQQKKGDKYQYHVKGFCQERPCP